MRLLVGTSGYSYPKWKGTFYPAKLPQKEMLNYYSQQFSTVEINSSFYRMPTVDAVESWARQAPDSFQFVLKAPQTITHQKRLKNAQDELDLLIKTSSALETTTWASLVSVTSQLQERSPSARVLLGAD